MRTAHGLWAQREGLLVRLESESGRIGFGECAPIPWFGTETADEAAAACATLGKRGSDEQIEAIGEKYPSLRFAVESAKEKTAQPEASPCLSLLVAALLPAGRAAPEKIRALSESGFRTFKWKVGASRLADADDEIALLDDVLAALPTGARLRLDANGAWTRRIAERWLARCADYSEYIEFIEQPIAPDAKGSEDLLRGLAADYPTPLALDESVATAPAIHHWLQLGWPGVFVIKPSLLGDAAKVLSKLPPDRIVFSSALETAVGAQAALRLAFQFYGNRVRTEIGAMSEGIGAGESRGSVLECGTPVPLSIENKPKRHRSAALQDAAALSAPATAFPRALGFGVYPLFSDARFDGPPAAPFVSVTDLDKTNPEILWNALN